MAPGTQSNQCWAGLAAQRNSRGMRWNTSCLLQSRQILDKAGQRNGAVGERFDPISPWG